MKNVYFNLNQMQHPCRRTMVGWTGTPRENREKIEPRECGLTHDHHGTISYAQPNHTPTQPWRESGARVAKYVAMIFAVLVMSMANIGMAWGTETTVTFISENKNDAGIAFAAMTNGDTQLVGSGLAKLIATNSVALSTNANKYGYRCDGSKLYIVFKFDGITDLSIQHNANSTGARYMRLYSFSSAKALSAITSSDWGTKTQKSFSSTNSSSTWGGGQASVVTTNNDKTTWNYSTKGCLTVTWEDLPAGYYVLDGTGSEAYIYSFTADVESGGDDPTPSTYTVTYDGNGKTSGDVPTDSNSPYNEGDEVTVLGNTGSLTKTGFTFAGWNTAANGSGASYEAGDNFDMGTANVTLYAQWELNLTTHTPGKYETAAGSGGYGKTLKTYSGRDYEIYTFNTSKLYAGSSVTSSDGKEMLTAVANTDVLTSDEWLIVRPSAVNSGGDYNSPNEFTFSSATDNDRKTHYVSIINTDYIALKVSGYDQFSFFGRDNGTGDGKKFVVKIDGESQTYTHSGTDNTVFRFDISTETHVIEITAEGTSVCRFRGFSLRLPEVACSAPTSPTITATPASAAYTEGDNISLTASATGTDGSTTYTWYKGADWATASAGSSIGSAATFTKNSCVEDDAGTYWCEISNGTGCEVQVSKTITVAAACSATANAGADKETTYGVGVAMSATAASSGYTGAWSIKTGSPSTDAGQLGTTSSNTMTFTPNSVGTYTLVWTVTDNSDGSCSASDEATVEVTCKEPTTTFADGNCVIGVALDLRKLVGSIQGDGDVSFEVKDANGTGATIADDGYSLSAMTAGTCTITATQAEDETNHYCEKSIDATITVSTAKRIYMKCGSTWCSDSPKFFVYSWLSSSTYTYPMTLADCETDVYYADIPSGHTGMLFTRQKAASTWIEWSGGTNFLNQSQDIEISTNDLFTCTGWSDSKGTFSGSTYSAPTRTIAYNANGGTGSMSSETGITCGDSQQLTANAFTRSGWTFTGWNTNKYGTGDAYADEATISDITENITLYAQWEKEIYMIATGDLSWWYDGSAWFAVYYWDSEATSNNGYVAMSSYDLCSTTYYKATIPGNGYDKLLFLRMSPEYNTPSTSTGKWNQTSDITYPSTYSLFTINGGSDQSCTGSWGNPGSTYTITFNGNGNTGGSMSDVHNICSGSDETLAENSYTREGWTFTGWNTNKYGTGTAYADEATISNITADITLYAQWEKTIYLQSSVSWWYNNDAWFAIYCFDSSADTNNKWVKMTRAEECSSPAVYEVTMPGNGFDKVIFCRMKAADTETLAWSNKDNQTENIAYPTTNDKFTISNGDNGQACTGSWGTYAIPTYTISYNKGTNGTGSRDNESKTCGVDFTLPSSAVFTRTGYTQTGWATSDGGDQAYALGGSYTTDAAVTFYPVWTADQYNVTPTLTNITKASGTTGANAATYNTEYSATFTANTGYELPSDVTVTIGEVAQTKGTGYTWTVSEGVGTFTVSAAKVTGDITLSITSVAKTYSITLDDNGGTTDGSSTATYNSNKLTSITEPENEGYVIGGYYAEPGCTNLVADADGNLEANVTISEVAWTDEDGNWIKDGTATLYAEWTSYTLTYNAGGGSGSMDNTTGVGTVTLRTNTFTNTGYVFAGWATSQANANAGTIAYQDGATNYSLTADATLYAVWYKVIYEFTPATSGDAPAINATISSSTGGTMTYTPSDSKQYISYTGNGLLFGSSGNCIVTVALTDNTLTQGTLIIGQLYATTTDSNRGLYLCTTSSTSEITPVWYWTPSIAGEGKTFTYTVGSSSTLKDASSFRLKRKGNANLQSLKVAKFVAPTAPTFTAPASTPDAVEYTVGDAITALSVTATGTPTPALQWYKNNSASTSGATLIANSTSATFTPSNEEESDLYYYCVATNIAGTAQSVYFHVTVNAAPTYYVTYANGGHGEAPDEPEEKVSSIDLPQIEAVTGYRHTAWTADKDVKVGGVTIDAGEELEIGATAYLMYDTEFTAVWTETYTADKGTYSHGSINISPAEDVAGSTVSIEAEADDDYLFTSWTIKKTSDETDVTSSVSLSSSTDAEATFTMPAYGVTVDATFTAIDYCSTFVPDMTSTDALAVNEEVDGTGTAVVRITGVGKAGELTYSNRGIRFANSDDEVEITLPYMIVSGTIIKVQLYWNGTNSTRGYKLKTSGGTPIADILWQADGDADQTVYYTVKSTDTGLKDTNKFRLAYNGGGMYLAGIGVGKCGKTAINPELAYSATALYLDYDPKTATPTLTGYYGSPEITYSSSAEDVVSVDAKTGEITAVATGTATITVNIDETTVETTDYAAGSAEIEITVAGCGEQTVSKATRSGSSASYSGWTGGSALVANLDGSSYKLKSGGYVGVQLPSTASFAVGDVISIDLTTGDWWNGANVDSIPVVVYADNTGTNEIYRTANICKLTATVVQFKVTSSMLTALESKQVTVYRKSSGETQNHVVNSVTVKRDICTDGIAEFTGDGANSNWSNTDNWASGKAPTNKDRVVITNNMTVNVTAQAKEIILDQEAGGTLTINAGQALVVAGTIQKWNGSKFVPTTAADLAIGSSADGNGTLIFENDGNAATVQMYSKATAEGGWTWQYIAAPAAVSALDNYYGGYLYKWVESSWAAVGRDATMELFAGYCVSYPTAGHTFAIEGALAPTTEQSITVPEGKSMVVGNSWTAPIQITQLEDEDFSGLLKNVYLYNTGNDAAGKASTTDNPTEGAIYAAGTYISVPIHSASYFDVKVISSLQGFFVKDDHEVAGGGTLSLSYSKHVRPSGGNSVVNGAMHAPKRVADETDRPAVLKMKVSGSQYDDRLILLEREDFTTGYDAGWDGDKMGDVATSPRITTTREDGTADAVAALPDLEGTLINFRAASTDDQYTLYFDYETEDAEPLYLLDLTNNAYTRVETGGSYTFVTTDKADHKRFALTRYRAPQITTGVEEAQGDNGQGKAVKFIENDKLYILRNGVLYDGTGKKVIEN